MGKRFNFFVLVLIVAFVFVLGFALGNYFTSSNHGINKILKESELNAESFLIEQQLIETLGSDCDFSQKRLTILSSQLWKLGKMLDDASTKKELGNSGYDFLKRKFHLMQIKTYALYKSLEKTCGKDVDVILFYFKKKDSESKAQGEILDDIVEEFDTTVFAIEFAYASELSFLEEYYDIKNAPALVINFENHLQGLQDYESIKSFLKDSQ